MNPLHAMRKPIPVLGILSIALAPLALCLVIYFAVAGDARVSFPRVVIVFAQYLLLALLGSGLVAGVTGIVIGESPRWLPRIGLLLTVCHILAIALFSIPWMTELSRARRRGCQTGSRSHDRPMSRRALTTPHTLAAIIALDV